jgi:hypothetical protein
MTEQAQPDVAVPARAGISRDRLVFASPQEVVEDLGRLRGCHRSLGPQDAGEIGPEVRFELATVTWLDAPLVV